MSHNTQGDYVENNNLNNSRKCKKCGKTNRSEDIYGYDFVPELANVLNIDEQKEKARELEDIDK